MFDFEGFPVLKTKIKAAAAAAVMTVALGAAGSASALSYVLNLSDGQSSLPTPYGQVDVDQFGANTLKYTVTLFDGLGFVDTGSHYAFSFDLVDAPEVTFGSVPSGFGFTQTQTAAGFSNSPFGGGFHYALTCTNTVGSCKQSTGGYRQPLVFTVTGVTGPALTLNSIDTVTPYQGNVVRFAADTIRETGGVTAPIGGGTLIAVPEPATWAIMIVGFGGVGALIRRRRTMAATA